MLNTSWYIIIMQLKRVHVSTLIYVVAIYVMESYYSLLFVYILF